MILACTCVHAFQDRRYGAGNRVHNPSTKGSACTVCGNVKSVGAETKNK